MERNLKRGTPAQDNPQNRGPVYGHFLIVLTLKEALGLSGGLSGFSACFLAAGRRTEPGIA